MSWRLIIKLGILVGIVYRLPPSSKMDQFNGSNMDSFFNVTASESEYTYMAANAYSNTGRAQTNPVHEQCQNTNSTSGGSLTAYHQPAHGAAAMQSHTSNIAYT
ncbi:hypothetical protein WOLCODRAFT_154926 [Wolfiporia cocos MD-104 SS10]|uniref:Uncharacterized protein n=1 Tax=Wolfiporia cocos (strain MD-104) TaxID=742152 RepID=A0A2H3K148_WOLCO|nr:hypothetical protein WOLCODRAFT_154926 [Wolfiporia cocos MD-104 SS10]